MTWFKVDDGFYRNPKTAPLSDTAQALWLRAATWSCDMLTDGVVPEAMISVLRGRKKTASELVDSGLWEKTESGYLFHDWFEYQPSAEETAELKEKRSEAGRRGAEKRWGKPDSKSHSKPIANAMPNTIANQKQDDSTPHGKPIAKSCPVSVPVTTKETTPNGVVKKHTKSSASKTLIPDDWAPTVAHRELAAKQNIDIEAEAAKFTDWAKANGRKYVDWDRAFSNWIRNSKNFNRPSSGYVNRAQQKLDDQLRRIREVEALEQSQPTLIGGSNGNSYGF